MALSLNVKTTNAAFAQPFGDVEVARILREVAYKVEEGSQKGNILDINGNWVGEWELELPTEDEENAS